MSDIAPGVLEPGINLYARIRRGEIKPLLNGQPMQVIFREAPGGPYMVILSLELQPDLVNRYTAEGYEVLSCVAPKSLWQKIKRSGATHIHKYRRESTGDVIYVLVMREDQYQEMQRLRKDRAKKAGESPHNLETTVIDDENN